MPEHRVAGVRDQRSTRCGKHIGLAMILVTFGTILTLVWTHQCLISKSSYVVTSRGVPRRL